MSSHMKNYLDFKTQIFVGVVLILNISSSACSCFGGGNVFQKIKESNIVFCGRVLEISADSMLDNQKIKFSTRSHLKNSFSLRL